MREIIANIDTGMWDKAKQIWIEHVIRWNQNIQKNTISLFGSVLGKIFDFFKEYQRYNLVQICLQSCILNKTVLYYDSTDLSFIKKNDKLEFFFPLQRCLQCNSLITYEINFLNNPDFIVIYPMLSDTKIIEYPKILNTMNLNFKLLCTTVHKSSSRHFLAFFLIENTYFLVDDIGKKCSYFDINNKSRLMFKEKDIPVTGALYYKI